MLLPKGAQMNRQLALLVSYNLKIDLAKAAGSAATGSALVVALVPARTDTKWWHAHVAERAHAFLLKGRLRFGAGAEVAPFSSAVAAWGAASETVARLRATLPTAWHVPAVL